MPIPIQFALFDGPGGALIADLSHRVRGLTFSSGERGWEAARAQIPINVIAALRLYGGIGLPHVEVSANGTRLYEGRLEDPALLAGATSGLEVGALGYWRALTDVVYTALWSTTATDDWAALTLDDKANAYDKRFTFDTQSRLFIAPKKGATHGTTTVAKGGWLGYIPPDGGSRQIVGVSFDYEISAGAATWLCQLRSFAGGSWATDTVQWSQAGAAGLQSGAVHLTFAGADRLGFLMYYNAADAAYAGEDGAVYLKISNLRVVTSTASRINTTLTANLTAGAGVTASVGSTSGMYVGQRLQIASGGATSESVIVTALAGSTAFTATFANNHTSGQAVQAHRVLADDILKDLVAAATTLNVAQLSANTARIQSPGVDLTDEIYLDASAADIAAHLASLGGASAEAWEIGVAEGRMLYFRPQGSTGRTWYVDALDLRIERSLDNLANSVNATYQDPQNRPLRTGANVAAQSAVRYGVTRQKAIGAQTTSATQARAQRDAALADADNPTPRARIAFDRIYDASGARWPLTEPRAADTIVIRNLPIGADTALGDDVRSFRIFRAEYDVDADRLTVEPASPPATLDTLLARIAEGIRR